MKEKNKKKWRKLAKAYLRQMLTILKKIYAFINFLISSFVINIFLVILSIVFNTAILL